MRARNERLGFYRVASANIATLLLLLCYFATFHIPFLLSALHVDATHERLLGAKCILPFFANIFTRVYCGNYIIYVQVEKQTAGVLTDEPSWGQQLTVVSPEGGVALLEGIESSGHSSSFEGCLFFLSCERDGRLPCLKLIAVSKGIMCYCNCHALMCSGWSA